MKRAVLRAVTLAVALSLTSIPVFAQATYVFRLPEANEPIYGTWVNARYSGTDWPQAQKVVYEKWGYGGTYYLSSDQSSAYQWTFILLEKKIDAKGDVWYKEFDQFSAGKHYCLVKISKGGNVLETVSGAGFPQESDMSPKTSSYRIFYRQ